MPTRTSTRRSSGCSATSAARSTPAARGTTRSPRRSASTSRTRRRGRGPDPAPRPRAARPRRGGGRDADPRLHAPAARPAGHRRPPPARLGGDARARPRALPAAAAAARPSPLGAGALAGSTLGLPPPPGETARNSLDAVADRDFALDYLYAAAVLLSHLSRIGEELVLWATSEFGFVRLPEEAATGSSMMPHKLNPDVAELVRGKAGTAAGPAGGAPGDAQGAAARLQPRPPGGQAAVFGARRDVGGALAALTVLVAGLELDRERLEEACADPLLLATDAAENLVPRGRALPRGARAGGRPVRDGTFGPPLGAPRPAPGPDGVRDALAEARTRFGLESTGPVAGRAARAPRRRGRG